MTADGARNAAGAVYFHFYAGCDSVRVSHELIVTENTNRPWFRDIGVDLPIALRGSDAGVCNAALRPGAELVMTQDDFPHFGSTRSHLTIFEESNGPERNSGPARPALLLCGDGRCAAWPIRDSDH